MTKFLFKNAEFIKTACACEDYPSLLGSRREPLPEIAVAGRSNVGKSTLLNHLFQSKGLVKTSSTPGKTQALNFFTLNEQIVFVDLPGYGYAKVASKIKSNWGLMTEEYLNQRLSLKLLLFLVDIRRIPTEEDLQMMSWIKARKLPSILVLTKADKLNFGERENQTKQILKTFEEASLSLSPHLLYSAPKNEGRNQLINLITTCLN